MTTPLMEQYHKIKAKYRNEILLFRLGDFYEMFYEDAKIASKALGLALTSRAKGDIKIPMAGIPHHASQSYINRLLKSGYRVAICEQIQEPEEASGIVDRAVVRVITPGTVLEEGILSEREANYLASIFIIKDKAGLSWIDLSTGKFTATEINRQEVLDHIIRINPSECLLPDSFISADEKFIAKINMHISTHITPYHDWVYDYDNAKRILLEHFKVETLESFGLGDFVCGVISAGAIVNYLKETHKGPLEHITKIERYVKEGKVYLDKTTQKALEIASTMVTGERKGSLLWVIDKTSTPMGARLLKEWITSPLSDPQEINRRLEAVEEFYKNIQLLKNVQKLLSGVFDIERISARIGTQTVKPRDLVCLRNSLASLPELKKLLSATKSKYIEQINDEIQENREIYKLLSEAIVDDPPSIITEGGIIKDGFDEELDKTRALARNAKDWLIQYQQKQIQKTGIPSLKVGYNTVFGYYIEITHTHRDKIPQNYVRKQTLKNAERYITPELKDFETQMLNAQNRQKEMEYQIFLRIREHVGRFLVQIIATSSAIAKLDVICSLAQVAIEYKYVKPEVDAGDIIDIRQGRHPVLEQTLKERFVPNDAYLDSGENLIQVITGPNMAGKSTYIRQIALIALLAQIGSFVPAEFARIGVVDRISTRVGASDEIMHGQSTFMVEMTEAASILNNATPRTLIVLDEIGRGTSTYDGLSIAWAITEFVQQNIKARTLIATHYHELTGIAKELSGIKNYRMDVREYGDDVIFLYKVRPGAADKSYGIFVARLAGIPKDVIKRAGQILQMLEQGGQEFEQMIKSRIKERQTDVSAQLSLFEQVISSPRIYREFVQELSRVDLNNLTPIQALNLLNDIINRAKGISQ